VVRARDRAQQRDRRAGFAETVFGKFGDDRGGTLAAPLPFYGFSFLFPLLLLLVTMGWTKGSPLPARTPLGSVAYQMVDRFGIGC
jgi:uncharacterized BrkB/YihY/UPF0761 family membrane protein